MANEHIPTETIRKDIADTQDEIEAMTREISALSYMRDRWSMMKVNARQTGIKEREEFIVKLKKILTDRGEHE